MLIRQIRAFTKFNCQPPYFKGTPRVYEEAKAMGVIDARIGKLVEAMNRDHRMATTSSCAGHGFPFITVPPYVAFRTSTSIAARLSQALYKDSISSAPGLNYYWEVSASFNAEAQLIYKITIPSLAQSRKLRVTRIRLDQDFDVIALTLQEILDHVNGEQVEMKSQPNNPDDPQTDDRQLHL